MTLAEIRNEIWQQIGEPTDLDPTTDVQFNGGPLLTWVANEGQRQVATWRDGPRVFRHPQLYGEMFFRTYMVTDTIPDQTGMAANELLLPATSGTYDDEYNGWLVDCDGVQKVIVDYNGGALTATLDSDWDTTPTTGGVFKLMSRSYMLVDSTHPWASEHIVLPVVSDRWRTEGNFMEILKLEDISNQQELQRAPRVESYLANMTSTGDPMEYFRRGNRIYFDRAPDERLWFRMEYYRTPTDMVADDDEPEISEQFHYAVALWGLWWGYRRAGDNAAAYSCKMDLKDYMGRVIVHDDIKDDRRNDAGKLRRS